MAEEKKQNTEVKPDFKVSDKVNKASHASENATVEVVANKPGEKQDKKPI